MKTRNIHSNCKWILALAAIVWLGYACTNNIPPTDHSPIDKESVQLNFGIESPKTKGSLLKASSTPDNQLERTVTNLGVWGFDKNKCVYYKYFTGMQDAAGASDDGSFTVVCPDWVRSDSIVVLANMKDVPIESKQLGIEYEQIKVGYLKEGDDPAYLMQKVGQGTLIAPPLPMSCALKLPEGQYYEKATQINCYLRRSVARVNLRVWAENTEIPHLTDSIFWKDATVQVTNLVDQAQVFSYDGNNANGTTDCNDLVSWPAPLSTTPNFYNTDPITFQHEGKDDKGHDVYSATLYLYQQIHTHDKAHVITPFPTVSLKLNIPYKDGVLKGMNLYKANLQTTKLDMSNYTTDFKNDLIPNRSYNLNLALVNYGIGEEVQLGPVEVADWSDPVDDGTHEGKPSKDIQIGDYLLSDGSWVTQWNPQQTERHPVGIIFWVGNPCIDDERLAKIGTCTHGLAVALNPVRLTSNNWIYDIKQWNDKYNQNINYWQADQHSDYPPLTEYNKQNGYSNTDLLLKFKDEVQISGFGFTLLDGRPTTDVPPKTSGWYLPSVRELAYLCFDLENTWLSDFDLNTKYGHHTIELINEKLKAISKKPISLTDDYMSSNTTRSKETAYVIESSRGTLTTCSIDGKAATSQTEEALYIIAF